MQGYNALWMPGTDHAGIATQAVVERRLLRRREEDAARPGPRGARRAHLGVEGRIRSPHPRPAQADGLQLRLGAHAVHARRHCARAVRHTFFDLFKDGLIYRGKRLVNWDTFLQTAVSDDEVFHETVKGHFWHFRYPVIDPQAGRADARDDRHHAARDDARRHGRGRASRSGRGARQGRSRSSRTSWPKRRRKRKPASKPQLDDMAERRADACCRSLIKLRDMAQAGRKLMLPL